MSANALVLLLVYCNRFNVLCFASGPRSFPKASAKLQPKIPVCKFFGHFNVYLTLQAPKSPNFHRRQMFFARVHINTLKKSLPRAKKIHSSQKKSFLRRKKCSRRRKKNHACPKKNARGGEKKPRLPKKESSPLATSDKPAPQDATKAPKDKQRFVA